MTCKALAEKLKKFLNTVPLYSPFKIGQSIVIKINNCVFEIIKKNKGFQIKEGSNVKNNLVLEFKDDDSFQYLFGSKSLAEYGNRLVKISTQGRVTMNPGPFKDPMKSGFHRFIGYLKRTKGLQTYVCIIAVL